jgi:hypothetical protein
MSEEVQALSNPRDDEPPSDKNLDSFIHAAISAQDADRLDAGTFIMNGKHVFIAYGGFIALMKTTPGMGHLCELMKAPGRAILSVQLRRRQKGVQTGPADDPIDFVTNLERELEEKEIHVGELYEESRSEVDPTRKPAILERLKEAKMRCDLTRHLRDRLLRELQKDTATVCKAIRFALELLTKAHPQLGDHLTRSVSIGVHCRYAPETEVTWRCN